MGGCSLVIQWNWTNYFKHGQFDDDCCFVGCMESGSWTKNGAIFVLTGCKKNRLVVTRRCKGAILFSFSNQQRIESYQFLLCGAAGAGSEGIVSETFNISTSNFNASKGLNGDPCGGFFP